MIRQEVGERIRLLRKTRAKLSQEQFACKIGADRTYISRLECGKQNVTIENLETICRGLDITLKDFFSTFDGCDFKNGGDYERKVKGN